jgi:hypothetical protein
MISVRLNNDVSNPFIRTVNFEFSEVMNRMVEVSIYDFRSFSFQKEQMVTDKLMSLLDLVQVRNFSKIKC